MTGINTFFFIGPNTSDNDNDEETNTVNFYLVHDVLAGNRLWWRQRTVR